MTGVHPNRLDDLALPVLPTHGSATAGPPSQAQRHALALRHCDACEWEQAFAVLARLADEGHVPSAHLALLMASHGPALFREAFFASALQRAHWGHLSARCHDA